MSSFTLLYVIPPMYHPYFGQDVKKSWRFGTVPTTTCQDERTTTLYFEKKFKHISILNFSPRESRPNKDGDLIGNNAEMLAYLGQRFQKWMEKKG